MGQEPTPMNDPLPPTTTGTGAPVPPTTTTGAVGPPGTTSTTPTTADDPDLIRRDIDRTRGDMEDTIDAINDRVNPRRIRERRVNRVRRRWYSIRDSVMGSSSRSSSYPYGYSDYDDYGDERGSGLRDRAGSARDTISSRTGDARDTIGSRAGDARDTISSRAGDAREAVSERVGQARQAMSDAPDRVQQQTRGNPLTAGMIAFGVGALIGSALPESEAERRAARAAAERVDIDSAKEHLTEAAREVQSGVQDKAREAAEDLKGSAREAAQDVKGQAQQEGQRVKQDTQESGQQVRRQT